MKKLIGIAIAALLSVSTFGIADKAAAGELLDADRIVAEMQDSYTGYTYRNTMNYDKFVAALEDGYADYNYRNMTSYDKFVASLEDGYTGYNYKNTMNESKFVAALEDAYTADRYGEIMNNAQFAAVLQDKHEDQIASANDVPRPCRDEDVDYLSNEIVLAKLVAVCQ